jgi:signal transduction histidine kinase
MIELPHSPSTLRVDKLITMISNSSYHIVLPPVIPEETEQARLTTLQQYQIINTDLEVPFDDIAELAADACGAPIALITLIGKEIQWYIAGYGTKQQESVRAESFCSHTIVRPYKALIINDLQKDARFKNHPHVLGEPHYRFYAGIPITTPDGYAIGTLCVKDYKSRELNKVQIRMLKIFANQIITQLELQRKVHQLESTHQQLETANKELSRFAYVVAHDIRSPLKNIDQLTVLLEEENRGIVSDESIKMLGFIRKRSQDLNNLVSGILEYSLSGKNALHKENMALEEFIQKVIGFCGVPSNCKISLHLEMKTWNTDATLLHQILQNLISNAVKYNDKEQTIIGINIRIVDEILVEIAISDNGPGIPESIREKVFEPFFSYHGTDRFGKKGNGIGLATVKNLVERLDGRISLRNNSTGGSLFKILIPI